MLVPGTQLDDPYRKGEAKVRTPRRALLQPEPEQEPVADEYMTVLPGGMTLAEANRLREEARKLKLAEEARRHRDVLELVRDKVEAKSSSFNSVFRYFDANHDSKVSYAEFRQGLHNLGIDLSEQDFTTLVQTVDLDGQGTVDYNEFACVHTSHILAKMAAPDRQRGPQKGAEKHTQRGSTGHRLEFAAV